MVTEITGTALRGFSIHHYGFIGKVDEIKEDESGVTISAYDVKNRRFGMEKKTMTIMSGTSVHIRRARCSSGNLYRWEFGAAYLGSGEIYLEFPKDRRWKKICVHFTNCYLKCRLNCILAKRKLFLGLSYKYPSLGLVTK